MSNLITPVVDYRKPFSQTLEDKIKPLDTVKILKWNHKSEVKVLHGHDGAWERKDALTIGAQNIIARWQIEDPATKTVVHTGFFTSYDDQLKPQFNAPRFVGGLLILQPGNPTDEEQWRYIQVCPHNENNVLGIKPKNGPYRFRVDNVEEKKALELLRMKNISKATSAIDGLSDEELALVLRNTGCADELDLRRMAENDPQMVVSAIGQLAVISVREVVEKCFQPPYNLLAKDNTQNAIVWANGRQVYFQGGTTTLDLAEALTFYLMGMDETGKKESAKSKEQKSKFKVLKGRMAEIDEEIQKEKEAKAALSKVKEAEPSVVI